MQGSAIVLCRVKESGNLGSLCRAMKTMGMERLILANCPEYDEVLVKTMAVHAFDVYETAIRYASLEEALREFSLSAGFSRRSGSRRKGESISVRNFTRTLAGLENTVAAFKFRNEPVALVFGNERDGLSDEELACCSLAVHIPSSDAFPSLNVAQAVQVACYEIFISQAEANARILTSDENPVKACERIEVDRHIEPVLEAFAAKGAFRLSDRDYMRNFLRDLCERAGASSVELEYLAQSYRKALALGSKPDKN